MNMVPKEAPPRPAARASRGSGRAWWAAAIVTAINALTSAGFSVAGLVSTLSSGDEAARIFSMYAAARSLSLAAVILPLVFLRSTRGLGMLAIVMGLVQTCDAFIGVAQHDVGKTVGPAFFAVLTFAGVTTLLRGGPRKGSGS